MMIMARILGLFLLLSVAIPLAAQTERPNILWITSEDNGPQLGCYGDTYADTPNIDALAAKGQIYLNAWSNAPVCARRALRLSPASIPTVWAPSTCAAASACPKNSCSNPQIFKQQGYYTSNNVKERLQRR